jgi:hypothetical protein
VVIARRPNPEPNSRDPQWLDLPHRLEGVTVRLDRFGGTADRVGTYELDHTHFDARTRDRLVRRGLAQLDCSNSHDDTFALLEDVLNPCVAQSAECSSDEKVCAWASRMPLNLPRCETRSAIAQQGHQAPY